MSQPAEPARITNPADVFPEAVFAILVPLLMAACPCDMAAARAAAMDAIAAQNPTNPGQMVAIAQLIANGLISLDSLKQSIDPDLPIPTKLRLRGNAVALQRANHQATKTLQAERAPQPTAPKQETVAEAALQAAAEAAEDLVTRARERLERMVQSPLPRRAQTPAPTKHEEKLMKLLAETPPDISLRASALSSAAFRPNPGLTLPTATA